MEGAAAALAFDSNTDAPGDDTDVVPIGNWRDVGDIPDVTTLRLNSRRLPTGEFAVDLDVALRPDEKPSTALLVDTVGAVLRADSPDAPSTHAEAMRQGDVWLPPEAKELANHARNASWTTIDRGDVPAGRRIHKMLWVYKVKRDGTRKARLCVQGSTLESGVDFDQVFSAALRYSSARSLFAYAARHGCGVRSVDLVAAYLQGSFLEGEVVYCHLPPGYGETDERGRPRVVRVDKPIYGIQQAGRRLQRQLFTWLRDKGFTQLDDSDPCIFVKETPDGERLLVGLYVDNLQIVHSAALDTSGRGPKGCAYNAFMDILAKDWEVVDEGPMEDLLGI